MSTCNITMFTCDLVKSYVNIIICMIYLACRGHWTELNFVVANITGRSMPPYFWFLNRLTSIDTEVSDTDKHRTSTDWECQKVGDGRDGYGNATGLHHEMNSVRHTRFLDGLGIGYTRHQNKHIVNSNPCIKTKSMLKIVIVFKTRKITSYSKVCKGRLTSLL